MRIHHLNCGTFCLPFRRLFNGTGGLLERAFLSCHCLLIETGEGLVLVDTGLGSQDLAHPTRALGLARRALVLPEPDPGQSALRQIEALGFYPDDVRHIVVTHLDFDHAGGLPDFPQAEVHVFEDELQAAWHPRGLKERLRYKRANWAHGPMWMRYELEGDRWYGFDAVRALSDGETDILLIPLLGHTRGHCGVAVRSPSGWLLHCGDAYFCHQEISDPDRRCPVGLRGFERLMQTNKALRQANQIRLHELIRAHGSEVRVVCSHDPAELEAYQAPRAVGTRQVERQKI